MDNTQICQFLLLNLLQLPKVQTHSGSTNSACEAPRFWSLLQMGDRFQFKSLPGCPRAKRSKYKRRTTSNDVEGWRHHNLCICFVVYFGHRAALVPMDLLFQPCSIHESRDPSDLIALTSSKKAPGVFRKWRGARVVCIGLQRLQFSYRCFLIQ